MKQKSQELRKLAGTPTCYTFKVKIPPVALAALLREGQSKAV
jgi:hypothetical protein